MSDEKKLTIREVMERTGAKRSTVNRWCRKGRFPNAELVETPIGSYWLIPESDLKFAPVEVKLGRPPKED